MPFFGRDKLPFWILKSKLWGYNATPWALLCIIFVLITSSDPLSPFTHQIWKLVLIWHLIWLIINALTFSTPFVAIQSRVQAARRWSWQSTTSPCPPAASRTTSSLSSTPVPIITKAKHNRVDPHKCTLFFAHYRNWAIHFIFFCVIFTLIFFASSTSSPSPSWCSLLVTLWFKTLS